MFDMKMIELLGQVDQDHRLSASVPNEIPPGPVKFALVVPTDDTEFTGDDDAGGAWVSGVSHEWADELADPPEDIYNLNDGESVVASM
jgi:hypothetical protein